MVSPIVVSDLKALREVVLAEILRDGPGVDLNHVDVSGVDTFDGLFKDTGFCGDVSHWKTSKAKSMAEMFMGTPFNGDISNWDVKCLENTKSMFAGSLFNGDVSRWNAGRIIRCGKNQGMFQDSSFAQDLTGWKIANIREYFQMTTLSALSKSPTLWAAISGGKPQPTLPTQETLRRTTYDTYTTLFGGLDQLNAYLARTPFGVLHFDVCCVSETCPSGVSEADFVWSKDLLVVGEGLGMDNAGIRELCRGQMGLRNEHKEESLSLCGLCTT